MSIVPAGGNRQLYRSSRNAMRAGYTAGQLYSAGRGAYYMGRGAYNAAGQAYNYAKKAYNYYNKSSSKPSVVVTPNVRVGGMIGLETKFIDSSISMSTLTPQTLPTLCLIDTASASGVNHMTPVAQGSGESERVGRNIFLKSIHMKMLVQQGTGSSISTATNVSTYFVTIFIVQDLQCNSTSPAASAIWVNPANSQYTGGIPMLNLEYKDRFKIRATRRVKVEFQVASAGTSSTLYIPGDEAIIEWYKSFKVPLKQQYDATGGAVSDVTNTAFSVWYHVTPFGGNAGGVGLTANIRARYTS